MYSILNTIILGFALVGGIRLAQKILKSGWSSVGKLIAGLVLLGVGGHIFNPQVPLIGLFNPIAGLLSSYGIFIVGSHLVNRKKWAKDWRPQVITSVLAFALLATIWIPSILAIMNGSFSLPRVPIGGFAPSTPTVVQTSPTPPPAARHRPRRSEPLTSCNEIPYVLRQQLPRCAGR